MILSYAFAKILGTQFTSSPSTYDKPIGLLNGFELTWYYYGYSLWYGVFIFASQIASSLLLFFRKTTRLGIVLFLSFMVNIVLMDFAYDIDGAKGMAILLTIMALFVFFSEFPLFYNYFVTEPVLYQDKDRPNWVNKISNIKWVYIPIAFIGIFYGLSFLKTKYMNKDQLYGTWKNTDTTSILHRFNFESDNFFIINSFYDNKEIIWGNYSLKNDTIFLKCSTKAYQNYRENINANSEAYLQPDSTKNITYIKGKYQLNDKSFIIQTDSSKIVLNRIR